MDEWDDYDSLFYNEWLKVSIEPTRFIEWATKQRLGLETDLEEMITELGLGTMATHFYDLYPELVRQFMASVRVFYANDRLRRVSEGILTFIVRGIRYKIPLLTLCDIYGFQNRRSLTLRRSTLPRTVSVLGTFGIWLLQLRHSHADQHPPSHRALLPQGPCQHAVVQDGTEQGSGT